MNKPKIAFVYDRLNKFGGAERVLQTLHGIYPSAPIFTSVYDKNGAKWLKNWQVFPSFVQALPFAKTHHEAYVMLMPYAFESLDLSAYDIVISVTSAEAKGIITSPHQLHLCYLLTPTRYLYSHAHQYKGAGIKALIKLAFQSSLRRWDYYASQRPDQIIAISKTVANRTRKYYRRHVLDVIYPPVNTHTFKNHPASCYKPNFPYFLIVNRLVGYKNTQDVIGVFNKLADKKLIIVGKGVKKSDLAKNAGKNIIFKGSVEEDELICLYHHAQALIFPQEEDFGITAVESMAAGTPVIALNTGGATETVVNNKTGILYADNQQLIHILNTFNSHDWYDKTIRAQAAKFSVSRFVQLFSDMVEAQWQIHKTQ